MSDGFSFFIRFQSLYNKTRSRRDTGGTLRRKLGQYIQKKNIAGTTPSGRQLIRMIYDYCRESAEGRAIYNIRDLENLRCNGEYDLDRFQDQFDFLIENMPPEDRPSTSHKLYLYKEQIEKLGRLSLIFYHWREKDDTDTTKTFEWLWNEVERHINRIQAEKNKREAHPNWPGHRRNR